MNQQINLYQPLFRKQQKVFSALTMAQIVAIVALGLALIDAYGVWQGRQLDAQLAALHAQQQHDSQTLERLETTLAGRQPSAALTAAVDAAERERAAKRNLLDALAAPHKTNTTGFAPALAALAHTPVAGLWFTEIGLDDGGSDLKLVGATTRSTRVPELVRKLAHAPAFAGVEFKRLEIRRAGDAHGPDHLNFLLSTTAQAPDHPHAATTATSRGAH